MSQTPDRKEIRKSFLTIRDNFIHYFTTFPLQNFQEQRHLAGKGSQIVTRTIKYSFSSQFIHKLSELLLFWIQQFIGKSIREKDIIPWLHNFFRNDGRPRSYFITFRQNTSIPIWLSESSLGQDYPTAVTLAWLAVQYLLDILKFQGNINTRTGNDIKITEKLLSNSLKIWDIDDCELLQFLWSNYF